MVTVKEFAGTEKESPAFKIYDGSSLVHTEEIGGRADVQPAFLRVVDFCMKKFNVEIYAPRNVDTATRG